MKGDDFDKDSDAEEQEPAAASAPGERDAAPEPREERSAAAENDVAADLPEDDEADGFTHEGQPEFEQDDPLDPGFDIDEGLPLSRGRHGGKGLPERAAIKSAKEFFNGEILYRFDILEDEARNSLSGKYRIELKGFQGGIWTIYVGDQLEVINRREEADLVLTMQQRDFLQLVNGELNPQLAIFAQKLRVTGDVRKAVAFQALLAPEVE